jgi:hypothetical protein
LRGADGVKRWLEGFRTGGIMVKATSLDSPPQRCCQTVAAKRTRTAFIGAAAARGGASLRRADAANYIFGPSTNLLQLLPNICFGIPFEDLRSDHPFVSWEVRVTSG